MACPQNVRVDGLSSRYFLIEFRPKTMIKDAEHVFIDAILSDLMDALGDHFAALIVTYQNLIKINISMPKYLWIQDFANIISSFQKKTDEFISEPISIKGYHVNSLSDGYTSYSLIAKDGVYIEKKKHIKITTLKTIDDGSWCHGVVVPSYHIESTDL